MPHMLTKRSEHERDGGVTYEQKSKEREEEEKRVARQHWEHYNGKGVLSKVAGWLNGWY